MDGNCSKRRDFNRRTHVLSCQKTLIDAKTSSTRRSAMCKLVLVVVLLTLRFSSLQRFVSILLIFAVILCMFSCTSGGCCASEDTAVKLAPSTGCCSKCCERKRHSPPENPPEDSRCPDECLCQGVCGGAILEKADVQLAVPPIDHFAPLIADPASRTDGLRCSNSRFRIECSQNGGLDLRLRVCSLTC